MCFENDGWDDDWGDESEEACDQENAQAELIEKARRIVEDFHSSGAAGEHEENKKYDENCEYRTSSEHRIATQILQLEKLLDEYDDLRSDFYGDLTEVGLYAGRISMLVESLDEYQSKLEHFERKEEEILDLYDCGKISAQEKDDRLTETGFRKQRAGTRTEMAGLGMTYDDLGEISDRFNHLAVDFQLDDDGDTRHKIYMLLRSMDREKAIYLLEQAVMDGKISQETADYLIAHALRSS